MARKLHTSPRGSALYPHLTSPDTKFDPDGVYTSKLQIDAAAGAEFAAFLDQAMAASHAEAKKENPGKAKVKKADKPYSQEEDGSYTFNFKLKAKGKTREGEIFTQRPAIFDAKGNPLTDCRIGGGSTLRVSFQIIPFYTSLIGAGISLRLKAVQVLDLVEWGVAKADYYGFDEEEGFDASEASEANPFEEESENEAQSGDEPEAKFDF